MALIVPTSSFFTSPIATIDAPITTFQVLLCVATLFLLTILAYTVIGKAFSSFSTSPRSSTAHPVPPITATDRRTGPNYTPTTTPTNTWLHKQFDPAALSMRTAFDFTNTCTTKRTHVRVATSPVQDHEWDDELPTSGSVALPKIFVCAPTAGSLAPTSPAATALLAKLHHPTSDPLSHPVSDLPDLRAALEKIRHHRRAWEGADAKINPGADVDTLADSEWPCPYPPDIVTTVTHENEESTRSRLMKWSVVGGVPAVAVVCCIWALRQGRLGRR